MKLSVLWVPNVFWESIMNEEKGPKFYVRISKIVGKTLQMTGALDAAAYQQPMTTWIV